MSFLLSKILFMAAIIINNCVCDERTVKYYEDLIRSEVEMARKYKLPKDNKLISSTIIDEKIYDFGSYDFIVVGAGSAGCVVAKRLAEVSGWSILVLEAGGEENDFTDIVKMAPYVQTSNKNWGYFTTPQNNSCLARVRRKCFYPRGKGIGGSSILNNAIYSRAPSSDFDKWQQMGISGWTYEHVLPYFKKSENCTFHGDPKYHGFSGPLAVSYRKPPPFMIDRFLQASMEMNISIITDYNTGDNLGVSIVQMNELKGKRMSSGRAFLNSQLNSGLTLLKNALVVKILINDSSMEAQGVRFIYKGKIYEAKCRNEVILSAGTLNSPQLLMLSGIGPIEHLKSLGINVIKDLPVGRHLKDHVLYSGLNFQFQTGARSQKLVDAIRDYLNGEGYLASGYTAGFGFLVNNIEYIFIPPEPIEDLPPPQATTSNFNSQFGKNYLPPHDPKTQFSIAVVYLKEKSSGEVTLKSNNALEFPDIDTNILSHPQDLDELYEGIRFVLKVMESEAFRSVNATLSSNIPPCEKFSRATKNYWECAIRQMASPAFHATGTTRMGVSEANSVVGDELKVHGVAKLRVVDAGVIPEPLRAHTFATTVMIAEKISDSIKMEYNKV